MRIRGPHLAAFGLVAALVATGCGVGSQSSDNPDPAATTADDVRFDTDQWPDTEFAEHSVPLTEFMGGGPPKDGIPAIDDPKLIDQSEADEFLEDSEPIAFVEIDGEAKAYPVQILTWHEIVNDELAGEPISVTFCPLCNSTVAFSREVDGRVLDFGTTGNLRKSDLVMYDRQTESWWQQITAEAVVGELTGTKLEVLPSQILSWEEVKRSHPDAGVLSRDTGTQRSYGENPYVGYDAEGSSAFALDEEADPRLEAKARVAAIQELSDEPVVYPFDRIRDEAPINDEIDGTPIVVFFDPEVSSALDSTSIAEGREVGGSAIFKRTLDGRTLSFEAGGEEATFRDTETGSEWDMSGRAASGELKGKRLEQVNHDDQFWFALAAFFEDPDIRAG